MSDIILYKAVSDKLGGDYLIICKDGEHTWLVAARGGEAIPVHFMRLGMRGGDINPMIIWEHADLVEIDRSELLLYLHWLYKSIWFDRILKGY